MNNQMNLETVMLLVGSAIEKCYADNKLNLDFSIFEDIHYDLCILYKLETKIENDGYNFQHEADLAFYEKFGRL